MSKTETINPLGRYLIKIVDEVEKMKGSILLPETTSKERGNVAVVVKTPYNETAAPIVKVGDRIVFSKYTGTVLADQFSDVEYRLVKADDILGFFDGDNG